jgi:hypothetical protein
MTSEARSSGSIGMMRPPNERASAAERDYSLGIFSVLLIISEPESANSAARG